MRAGNEVRGISMAGMDVCVLLSYGILLQTTDFAMPITDPVSKHQATSIRDPISSACETIAKTTRDLRSSHSTEMHC